MTEDIDANLIAKLKDKEIYESISLLNLKCLPLLQIIFYITAKLAKCRENRYPHNPINAKTLTFLTKTAHYHISNMTEIHVSDRTKLLPRTTTTETAELYFIDNLTNLDINDVHGRTIKIKDEHIDCYYKDDRSGRHIVSPEFYKIYRARRLPWIIPSLTATKEIYQLNKPKFKCIDFFYVTKVDIPYEDLNEEEVAEEKYYINYFIVVARRAYNMKTLELVTIYPMFDYLDLLKYIERWSPFEGK